MKRSNAFCSCYKSRMPEKKKPQPKPRAKKKPIDLEAKKGDWQKPMQI